MYTKFNLKEMAKRKAYNDDGGLPFFKFFIQPWLVGNIKHCSHSAQGLFINVCVLYWGKKCEMTITDIRKSWPRKEKYLAELLSSGVVKVSSGQVIISFLDEQLTELTGVSQKNRENAKARWNQNKSDATAMPAHEKSDATAMPIEKKRIDEEEIRLSARVDFVEDQLKQIEAYHLPEQFKNKSEAFDYLKTDDFLIDDIRKTVSAKGWRAVDEVDVVGFIKLFVSAKAKMDQPPEDMKQHFRNWIFREPVDKLTEYAKTFKKSLPV